MRQAGEEHDWPEVNQQQENLSRHQDLIHWSSQTCPCRLTYEVKTVRRCSKRKSKHADDSGCADSDRDSAMTESDFSDSDL